MKKLLFIFLLIPFIGLSQGSLQIPYPVKRVTAGPIDYYARDSNGNVWTSTSAVTTAVSLAERYRYQTFAIAGVEYWFATDADVTSGTLTVKVSGGSSYTFADGLINSSGTVTWGGTFADDITIGGGIRQLQLGTNASPFLEFDIRGLLTNIGAQNAGNSLIVNDQNTGGSYMTGLTYNSVRTGNLLNGTDKGVEIATGTASTTSRLSITDAGVWKLAGAAGTSGQVLTSAGPSSPPTWTTVSGGSGTPAGSNLNLQYNNAGAFGAIGNGTTGQVLTTVTTGSTPTWQTPTGGGSTLTPTSVKTSSYTASASDAVLTDARTAIIPITLPTAPTDKTQISVKQLYLYTPFFTKILTGGSDVLNTGANIAYLYTVGQSLTFQYQSSTSTWIVTSDDISLSQIEARTRNYGKIIVPRFSTLSSFGSSITAGVPGPTATASTYTELVSNALGNVKNNQGIGSTSSSTASLTALSISGLNKNPITAELGINDIRSSTSTATYERIKGALRAILANQFVDNSPLPANSGSITQSGTWSTVTAHSIGEKASYIGGLALKGTATSSTLTFSITGTSLVIGTFGVDGTTQAGGVFTISVDGGVVYTFDNRGLTNGTTDGGGFQGTVTNNAIVLQRLSNTSHTIVITITSLSASGAVFIDYVGTLKKYADCQGVIVTTIPKLDATGYSGGAASDNADNLADANALQIINNEFYGFPIAFVDLNKDFNPTTDLYTDHIHRNDLGNQKIANAILSAVNTNSPRISSEFVTHVQSQQTWDAYYGVGYIGTNRNVQTGLFDDPTKGSTVHYMVPSTSGGRHEWWVSNAPNTNPFPGMKLMENSTVQLWEATGSIQSFLAPVTNGLNIFTNRDPISGTFSNGSLAASGIALGAAVNDGSIYFYTSPTSGAIPSNTMKLDKNGQLTLGITSIYSNSASGGLFMGGAHYDGTNYIADGTSANFFVAYGNGSSAFDLYSNTGLTPTTSFTPSGIARFSNSGLYIGNVTTATAKLHLAAGTATAGTSPLKLTSGTNLTTTEAGAIEFDGTHFYGTITNGGTRYQLDQQSGGSGATSLTGDVTGTISGSAIATTIKTNVALAGSPTTTTQTAGDNSTKIATTAFVTSAALPAATDSQDGYLTQNDHSTGILIMQSNPSDANFTAAVNSVYHLAKGTLTANRTITLPTGSNGNRIILKNNEIAFNWLISGSLYLSDDATLVTQLLANTTYYIQKVDGHWSIIN